MLRMCCVCNGIDSELCIAQGVVAAPGGYAVQGVGSLCDIAVLVVCKAGNGHITLRLTPSDGFNLAVLIVGVAGDLLVLSAIGSDLGNTAAKIGRASCRERGEDQ